MPPSKSDAPAVRGPDKLAEGVDYYLDGGLMVLTATYLLRRGYCCNSGCRHCPYGDNAPRVRVRIVGPVSEEDT